MPDAGANAIHNGSYTGPALPTGQVGAQVSASFARPANTTAYAADDRVGDSASAPTNLAFANAVLRAGGTAWLASVDLLIRCNPATKGDFDLLLFRTDVAAGGDNVAIAVSDDDQAEFLGLVRFDGDDAVVSNARSAGDGNVVYKTAAQFPVEAASGSTTIYGVLKAAGAYTPIASEHFTVILHLSQDG